MPKRRKSFFVRLTAHPIMTRAAGGSRILSDGPLGRLLNPLTARLRKLGLLESINRFVLTIGDEGATLVQLRGNQVIDAMFVGPEDEDGLGTLRGYLAVDPRARLIVAADVLEQMYREEQMPKVGRFDRANVMKRRLDVAFPQDRLKAALPLGVAGKAMFASLPETEAIKQWVEFLESLPNPIVGFCLMPLESADMAEELGPAITSDGRQVWRVLVTQQATSGFRQVFETEGRMVVTRLAQHPSVELSSQDIAQLIERELRSSITYVKRLGYSEQERLDLIVLGEPDVCRAVEERDLPISSLTTYTPYQAGLMLGLGEVAPEESGLSDVLHARWLASKRRPLTTLPTAALRERLVHDHIFKMGFIAAAALSLFAVSDLVSLVLDAFDTTSTTDLMAQQLVTEHQAADITRAKLASFDVSYDDVHLVDETAKAIVKNTVDVNALLRSVAGVLGPDTVVQKATYRVPALASDSAGRPAPAGPQRVLPGRAAPPRANEIVYELSLVVRFEPNPAAPQVPLEQAKALQDHLVKLFPGDTVNAVKLPVNPLRSQVIEGSTGGGDTRQAGPQIAEYLIQKRG